MWQSPEERERFEAFCEWIDQNLEFLATKLDGDVDTFCWNRVYVAALELCEALARSEVALVSSELSSLRDEMQKVDISELDVHLGIGDFNTTPLMQWALSKTFTAKPECISLDLWATNLREGAVDIFLFDREGRRVADEMYKEEREDNANP